MNKTTNMPYQPKTGQPCHCRRGQARDNCPDCEGTGQRIDFAAIRARSLESKQPLTPDTLLSTGRKVVHSYMANGAQSADIEGERPEMTEAEFEEYGRICAGMAEEYGRIMMPATLFLTRKHYDLLNARDEWLLGELIEGAATHEWSLNGCAYRGVPYALRQRVLAAFQGFGAEGARP